MMKIIELKMKLRKYLDFFFGILFISYLGLFLFFFNILGFYFLLFCYLIRILKPLFEKIFINYIIGLKNMEFKNL